VSRRRRLWTWDRGHRGVDFDGDLAALVPTVQTILDGGLWQQFRKIPTDVLKRLLPHLQLEPETRRLVELWIEEAPQAA